MGIESVECKVAPVYLTAPSKVLGVLESIPWPIMRPQKCIFAAIMRIWKLVYIHA